MAANGNRAFAGKPVIEVEWVNCGLCDNDDAEPYAESFDYEYQTCANRWTFVRCKNCDNVYLNPRPARSTLSIIYPPNYYSYGYDQQVNAVAKKAKAILDSQTFAGIRKYLTVPLRKYLDVGCGDGRYLHVVSNAGIDKRDIYGIELDAGVAASLCAEGFQVDSIPFEEATGLPRNEFQLITFFSVLEHVASPRAALKLAFDLLQPGGIAVFEVPNIKSSNARLFRDRYWGGYHTPRHWNLFSIATVSQMAPSLGFDVRALRRTTGHAFWLWSIHHWLRFRCGWDAFGKLFNPMKCLIGLAAVTPIDLIRAKLNRETDNTIFVLQKPHAG